MVNNPGRRVTPYDICNIFTPAYLKAATADKAISGFRCTGIYPYNPEVVTETDFAPLALTEKSMSVSTISMPSTVSQMPALDDDVSSFASVEPVICLSMDAVSTEADKSLPNTNMPTQPRLLRIKTSTPTHDATDEVEKSKHVALSKKQASQSIHSERNTNTVASQKEIKSVPPTLLKKSKNESVLQGQLHSRASRLLYLRH